MGERIGPRATWRHGRRAAVVAALADMAGSSSPPTAMLVMATHGRTGWDRLRLGSVTTATIRSATVPVGPVIFRT